MSTHRIILVHGFMNVGFVFFRMKSFLEKRGSMCLAPTLKPFDARYGVEAWAEQLHSAIVPCAGEGSCNEICLVGFSLGGVVARYYAQHFSPPKRIRTLVTIASPHSGTHKAKWYPGLGMKQIRPGSPFLDRLKQGDKKLAGMDLHAFWSPYDGIIRPTESARWDAARNHRFAVPLHFWMILHRPVLERLGGILNLGGSSLRVFP